VASGLEAKSEHNKFHFLDLKSGRYTLQSNEKENDLNFIVMRILWGNKVNYM